MPVTGEMPCAAPAVVFLSFRHFSPFNMALLLSVCQCRAGILMVETQNRAEIHPLLVYVSAGPCAHLLEEPVQTGRPSTFEQAPLSGRRMHCFHHLVGFLFREWRLRPPQRSGSKAWFRRFAQSPDVRFRSEWGQVPWHHREVEVGDYPDTGGQVFRLWPG